MGCPTPSAKGRRSGRRPSSLYGVSGRPAPFTLTRSTPSCSKMAGRASRSETLPPDPGRLRLPAGRQLVPDERLVPSGVLLWRMPALLPDPVEDRPAMGAARFSALGFTEERGAHRLGQAGRARPVG